MVNLAEQRQGREREKKNINKNKLMSMLLLILLWFCKLVLPATALASEESCEKVKIQYTYAKRVCKTSFFSIHQT